LLHPHGFCPFSPAIDFSIQRISFKSLYKLLIVFPAKAGKGPGFLVKPGMTDSGPESDRG
jgi:hypothetical protein